jgi:hypothetical protein
LRQIERGRVLERPGGAQLEPAHEVRGPGAGPPGRGRGS